MADLPQVKAWIAQAKADFEAAKAGPMTECYQRYWYQQSYEKTIVGKIAPKKSSSRSCFCSNIIH